MAITIDGNGNLSTNLNADQLDGNDSTAFALLSGATFTGNVGVDVDGLGELFVSRPFGVNPTIEGRIAVSNGTGEPIIIRRISDGTEGGRLGVLTDDVTFREGGSGADRSIVAYGSTSNGEYVRFYDGTQICWGTNTATLDTYSGISCYYPVNFVSGENSFMVQAGTKVAFHYGEDRNDADRFKVQCFNAGGGLLAGGTSVTVVWSAIGRWY